MKGKIYKLTNGEVFYIGSTISKLSSRLSKHRDLSKKANTLLYKTMFEKGPKTFTIELIEEIEYNIIDELLEKENEYIKLLNPQLNINNPKKWNEEDLKIYRENYYKINKEQITIKNKIYRENNKEKIKEHKKQKRINCPKCNKDLHKDYLKNHLSLCNKNLE
jgi:hypothetical protein